MSTQSEPSRDAILGAAVSGTRFERIGWVAETGSTNDDLMALARNGAREQVLVTDLQTAGRGRRDRVWTAPSESGVLMSFLVRNERGLEPFWIIGAVALAAAQAISVRTVERCLLKWPNDLLIGGAKVAGILAQGYGDIVIPGIGINANWQGQRPEGVPEHATSIDSHLDVPGTTIDRVAFVADVVRGVDELLGLDVAALRARWRAASATIGQQVRVELGGDEQVRGTAVEVDLDGALLVEVDGERRTFHVGDVVHLRPA